MKNNDPYKIVGIGYVTLKFKDGTATLLRECKACSILEKKSNFPTC